MLVEIWSDVACPWCAIGRARFGAALADFPHADEVEVRWRSFELDPNAPHAMEGSYVERLARKYRVPDADAQAMIDRMTATAAEEGLDFRFDVIRPGNTFDAHRLIHLGAAHGIQDAVKARFLRGYLEEGEHIADHDTLRRLALDAGLPDDEVADVLAGDRFADAVREDEATAHEFGISGVPFFVLDRQFGLSGAQPAETMRKVLDHAWSERQGPRLEMVGTAAEQDHAEHDHVEGEACADGSCAV